MLVKFTFVCLAVLASSVVADTALPVGKLLPRSSRVNRRQALDVVSSLCPASQFQCINIVGCCPIGYYCGSFNGKDGCCPNGDNCGSQAPPAQTTAAGGSGTGGGSGGGSGGNGSGGTATGGNGSSPTKTGNNDAGATGSGSGGSGGNRSSPSQTGSGSDGSPTGSGSGSGGSGSNDSSGTKTGEGSSPTGTSNGGSGGSPTNTGSGSSGGSPTGTESGANASGTASGSGNGSGAAATATSTKGSGTESTGTAVPTTMGNSLLIGMTDDSTTTTEEPMGTSTGTDGGMIIPLTGVDSTSTSGTSRPSATTSQAGNAGTQLHPAPFSTIFFFSAVVGGAIMLGGTIFSNMV
ncbi:hypothetical protein H072_4131 [Dactylellina haptotyla CBS 200.50]|uniref:Granulins domain-containing protein n=1 Tax=Dactylellina haptotyla (strain CBS 200.50) TaxID=1284197 RepID=S8AGB8_DACHA|nr:hypothetical protein H072_4131 [Dactylellina haptotyla CBS 200.50]